MIVELWHQLFPSVVVFLWLSLAVLIAGTVRSFTGFGGGLVLAPLFSLFMAPADMVVVVLLLALKACPPRLGVSGDREEYCAER